MFLSLNISNLKVCRVKAETNHAPSYVLVQSRSIKSFHVYCADKVGNSRKTKNFNKAQTGKNFLIKRQNTIILQGKKTGSWLNCSLSKCNHVFRILQRAHLQYCACVYNCTDIYFYADICRSICRLGCVYEIYSRYNICIYSYTHRWI